MTFPWFVRGLARYIARIRNQRLVSLVIENEQGRRYVVHVEEWMR